MSSESEIKPKNFEISPNIHETGKSDPPAKSFVKSPNKAKISETRNEIS